jgi:hypothetical protein
MNYIGACGLVIMSTWFANSGSAQGGTASISGSVVFQSDAVVPGASVELTLDQPPGATYRCLSDEKGAYAFSGLAAGEYRLTLSSVGLARLKLDGITIGDGQHKTMPPLEMFVALSACSDSLSLDHIRLLDSADESGDLVGSVKVDQKDTEGQWPPVAGAVVRLFCGQKNACAIARTDALGQFEFHSLTPGSFSLVVRARGYYPVEVLDMTVQKGRHFVYRPLYVERCPRGNCSPRRRPKKPLVICE